MKKYAIILAALLVMGLGLTYLLLTQDRQYDRSVFDGTMASIHSLKAMDRELALELNNSIFKLDFNEGKLFDLNYKISEEFDNLRFEQLIDKIETESELRRSVSEFETQFTEQEKELEKFIELNSLLSKSLTQLSQATQQLQTSFLGDYSAQVNSVVAAISHEIYRLALGHTATEFETANQIKLISSVTELQFDAPQSVALTLSNFKSAAQTVFNNHTATQTSLKRLNGLHTHDQVIEIENTFQNYTNQRDTEPEKAVYGLIIYGMCLLAAALLFGIKLRRNLLNLEKRAKEVETAYEELQDSQEQVIQSEKMSSLGQMVAGVAHEINTPLGYVSSNINSLKENFSELRTIFSKLDEILTAVKKPDRESVSITKELVSTLRAYRKLRGPELMQESEQLINDGDYGLMEMSKLVKTLKDFSRIDRQSTEQVDVHDCIRSSVTIASNHIRDNNVELVENFGSLPKIACFPSKLNQLFLNIITNACQAMSEKGGELMILTERHPDHIVIRFADQGRGMDKETQQKMFDPFFTSKKIGEGTGLGMSIAYKIIEAHDGKIEVDSTVGEGTVISIFLPLKKA